MRIKFELNYESVMYFNNILNRKKDAEFDDESSGVIFESF